MSYQKIAEIAVVLDNEIRVYFPEKLQEAEQPQTYRLNQAINDFSFMPSDSSEKQSIIREAYIGFDKLKEIVTTPHDITFRYQAKTDMGFAVFCTIDVLSLLGYKVDYEKTYSSSE